MSRPNKKTPGVPGLHSINYDQRLYVMPSGGGFSCYGFDVLHKRTAMFAAFAERPDLMPPAKRGTVKAWRAYKAALDAAQAFHKATGRKCEGELEPRLRGLEGRRVEVTSKSGERRRFNVGKSGGWVPIHLEVHNARSTGGGAAYLSPSDRIEVVR